jgi:hypothetical protein
MYQIIHLPRIWDLRGTVTDPKIPSLLPHHLAVILLNNTKGERKRKRSILHNL